MKLRISYSTGIDKKLFYLLLISTIFGYLGYYFYSRDISLNVYFSYGNYNDFFEKIDLFPKIIRFSKDILVVLLTLVLGFKLKKNQSSLLLGYMFFIAWGLAIAMLNGGTLLSIISGVRSYIYVISLSFFFSGLSEEQLSIKAIERILLIGLVLNLAAQMEQAYRCLGTHYELIGVGSFRFSGFFGGMNGLASFAIGVALFYFVYDVYLEKASMGTTIFAFVCCFLVCYFSGTRSAMINVLLVICGWLIFKLKIKREQRFFFAIVVAVVAAPVIITFATNMADRGDIFAYQLQNGRLRILFDLLKTPSFLILLFGRGLGAGSNTEAVIKYEYEQSIQRSDLVILDGAFNVVIYQFGLIGLLVVAVIFVYISKKLTLIDNNVVKYVFLGTVFLQAFTANIFELHAFILVLIVVYVVLTSTKFDVNTTNRMELIK